MRLNKFYVNEGFPNLKGLKPFRLENLGGLVALVGKNGSGKTRILKLIAPYLQSLEIGHLFDHYLDNIPDHIKKLLIPFNISRDYLIQTNRINDLKSHNPNKLNMQLLINELRGKLNSNPPLYQNYQEAININNRIKNVILKYVIEISNNDIANLQEILKDPNISLDQIIDDKNEFSEKDEISIIKQSAITYTKQLASWVAFYRRKYSNEEEFKKNEKVKKFFLLQSYLENFLDKKLTFDFDEEKAYVDPLTNKFMDLGGKAIFDNKSFDYSILSDGEKTLFAYSIYFFLMDQNPLIKIKDSIIIIDEPETHLHPELQIKLLNGLRKSVGENGQIWMGTHSLSILSHLNENEIFKLKDGVIYPPKYNIPGESLKELMGVNEHIERLGSFIIDLNKYAFSNFISECFKNPNAMESAKKNDSQIEVFKKFVADKDNLLLLDYGAGKGRFYTEIVNDKELKKKIEYHALEINDDYSKIMKEKGIETIYNNYEKLPDNSFDLVLLCNVLHEIRILNWNKELKKIISSLKENGYLIIIEDKFIPKGEKPNENGFLILGPEEFKLLFNMESEPSLIESKQKEYKDRILYAVIQKNDHIKIDEETIKNTLKLLKENSYKNYLKLKKETIPDGKEFEYGVKTAMYSELYLNSIYSLKLLNGEEADNI